MIADVIENVGFYTGIHPGFELVAKFLAENDVLQLENGRYEIDGDKVFALVQAYTTRPETENKWETHKKYADIQYIVKGEEAIGWVPERQLTIREGYSNEKDITFYGNTCRYTSICLKEGEFAVFFPQDGHKPCCSIDSPVNVKKIVFKIKLK